MTDTQIIGYAAIVFICIPAMLKNWTAHALFGSFVVGQAWWFCTRLPQPLHISILCDYLVLVVIGLKAGPFKCMELDDLPGTDWWTKSRIGARRIRMCLVELSNCDKIIAGLFPLAWAASGIGLTVVQEFWFLWGVALVQIVLCGVEAVVVWYRGRTAKQTEAHPVDWLPRQRYASDEW